MYHISSYLASKQAHRTEYIEHVSNQNSDQLLQSYCEAACIIWKFMNFYPKCKQTHRFRSKTRCGNQATEKNFSSIYRDQESERQY